MKIEHLNKILTVHFSLNQLFNNGDTTSVYITNYGFFCILIT